MKRMTKMKRVSFLCSFCTFRLTQASFTKKTQLENKAALITILNPLLRLLILLSFRLFWGFLLLDIFHFFILFFFSFFFSSFCLFVFSSIHLFLIFFVSLFTYYLLLFFFLSIFSSFRPDITLIKCLKGLKSQKSLFVSKL